MKKIIFIVVIIGMFGWAVYQFAYTSDETEADKLTEKADEIAGNTITSPPKENDDEKAAPSDDVGLSKGDIAPDFELETMDGKKVRLSDYRGKRVIVNFWATWCPPCRAEIPDLQKLYDKKDVEILAVNLTSTEESVIKVANFVEEFEMTFPVLKDTTSDVATTYQVAAYPTSYMIDSNGRIQFMALGAMNYDMMVKQTEKMK